MAEPVEAISHHAKSKLLIPGISIRKGYRAMSFEQLTPEVILSAVERALGADLTSLISPLPSYINRVFELLTRDKIRVIVKFYRPNRWTREALAEEHQFISDCAELEIPVVAPLVLSSGGTLAEVEGIHFAVFPKKAGRQLEIVEENDWRRVGSLIARVHLAGAQRTAPSRTTIDPKESTREQINYLCTKVIPERFRQTYQQTASQLIELCGPLFSPSTRIRLHGDCHAGNILDRPGEGLSIIDFDDMAMGPPIQDLWLLLPDRADKAQRELDLMLEGYERFRQFDRSSLRLIEPLRAMRMVYFLAWVSRQTDDYQFRRNFPDWGSDTYWQKEINDLREQMGFVRDAIESF